ncbi:MAG: hypothetical protein COV08_02020 [Candidatus Vogelbacteria bacterium CG10_big_fil_rev_8_21_14_0_10_49_38]|uniref:Uncharacterized protein n=1 Tax=Candidatus Vogelbacteria bacterium CG10_big_fil_rev_8_21_14_0_10_49_38 TaxID=1975043 RepID=A0A2H0RHV9_9BACT|nr:MAG: hypothetical protein BK006_02040 [bacterium CG10_49_38]PIR46030.1 MAG: hypothetical protein COV08_02020 [Candidatus Vogelbacteria bacterium CG10_big_fil_rev_8_21_14_0_10_49_38]
MTTKEEVLKVQVNLAEVGYGELSALEVRIQVAESQAEHFRLRTAKLDEGFVPFVWGINDRLEALSQGYRKVSLQFRNGGNGHKAVPIYFYRVLKEMVRERLLIRSESK